MPQLNPEFFLTQIFWLFVLFGVIYIFIAKSATPKITDILERRQNRISSDLEEAASLQAQAEEARIAHEKALEDARAKATGTVAAKREAIKAEVEAEYNKLSEKLSGEAAKAEKRIAKAKGKALDDIRMTAVDACGDIVNRISGIKLASAASRFPGAGWVLKNSG